MNFIPQLEFHLPSSPTHPTIDIVEIRTNKKKTVFSLSMKSRESPLSIDAGLAFIRSIFLETRTERIGSQKFIGIGRNRPSGADPSVGCRQGGLLRGGPPCLQPTDGSAPDDRFRPSPTNF